MGYFQVRYDSRVVNYDRRCFIRLARVSTNDARSIYSISLFVTSQLLHRIQIITYFLLWSNPIKLDWRLALQWSFLLWWMFSAKTLQKYPDLVVPIRQYHSFLLLECEIYLFIKLKHQVRVSDNDTILARLISSNLYLFILFYCWTPKFVADSICPDRDSQKNSSLSIF